MLKSSQTTIDFLYLIIEHKEGIIGKKFQPCIICRSRENLLLKVKAAKKLLKSSPTAIDVLYLILLHIDGNVHKKFQPSIFYRSQENQL